MEHEAYLQMAEIEGSHWWFSARRKIIEMMVSGLVKDSSSRILEIGCGTGGNLQMLSKFGKVSATEMDSAALTMAQKKTAYAFDIQQVICPNPLPFAEHSFDLVCMFDVLEHIDDDVLTLVSIKKVLAPGGKVLLVVPAYQWMWSYHDEFLHHKRRYSRQLMKERSLAAGFKVNRISYCNTLMFPAAALARLNPNVAKANVVAIPSAPINFILKTVFQFERHLLPMINLPYGLSLIAVLES